MDQVPQPDHHHGTSAVSTTVHPILGLPAEILSRIPTHLPPQDRFRASFVCHFWRQALIECGALWSEIDLSKGKEYVETLLDRAKGSHLEVRVDQPGVPSSTMSLFSSRTEQIKCLEFGPHGWADVKEFMATNPGRFSDLEYLSFDITADSRDDFGATNPPPALPLFSTANRLRELHFNSQLDWSPPLNSFVFPELVIFDFTTRQLEELNASQLFNFLEVSPRLQVVRITANISLDIIPPRPVVLHNVRVLDIVVTEGGSLYQAAAHISCPSITNMSLGLEEPFSHDGMDQDNMFPTWNEAIIEGAHRMGDLVEEVTLSLYVAEGGPECKLALRFPNGIVIQFSVYPTDCDQDEDEDEALRQLFTAATATMLGYPHLASVNRFSIGHNHDGSAPGSTLRTANEARGPPEPLGQLVISQQRWLSDAECAAAAVNLARKRQELGAPFGEVIVRAKRMPAGMGTGLEQLVRRVEHVYDVVDEDDALDEDYEMS